MLSETEITKYIMIHKGISGKEISREKAYEQGSSLLGLIDLIYRPMTLQEYKKVEKIIKEIKT